MSIATDRSTCLCMGDDVGVISAAEFCRLSGELTGEALITAMQASPSRDVDIEPVRVAFPVRDVPL